MKNFSSVSTAAARFQDITPNPQKLAGQCAKLKCCLNYEVDTYMEAARKLPERNATLETLDGTFYFFKADILAGEVTYSSDRRLAANLVTISAERAKEVLAMNAAGEKPESLTNEASAEPKRPVDLAEQDDLTRFDKARRNKGRNNRRDRRNNDRNSDRNNKERNNAENKQGNEGEGGQQPRRERRDNNRRRNDNNRRDRRDNNRNNRPQGNTKPDTPEA